MTIAIFRVSEFLGVLRYLPAEKDHPKVLMLVMFLLCMCFVLCLVIVWAEGFGPNCTVIIWHDKDTASHLLMILSFQTDRCGQTV